MCSQDHKLQPDLQLGCWLSTHLSWRWWKFRTVALESTTMMLHSNPLDTCLDWVFSPVEGTVPMKEHPLYAQQRSDRTIAVTKMQLQPSKPPHSEPGLSLGSEDRILGKVRGSVSVTSSVRVATDVPKKHRRSRAAAVHN